MNIHNTTTARDTMDAAGLIITSALAPRERAGAIAATMLEAGRLAGDAPLTARDLLRGLYSIRIKYVEVGSENPAIIGRAKEVREMLDALYEAEVPANGVGDQMSLRASLAACARVWFAMAFHMKGQADPRAQAIAETWYREGMMLLAAS